MNQFSLIYIYIWKYHSETPYIAILNKQKCLFSKMEKAAKQVLSEKLVPVEGEEDIRKVCRRVNVREIYVCKWKSKTC
jgi:hypothetical protein